MHTTKPTLLPPTLSLRESITFAALMRGDYPYKLIAQSQHFLVFANTDTEHSNITSPHHKENP